MYVTEPRCLDKQLWWPNKLTIHDYMATNKTFCAHTYACGYILLDSNLHTMKVQLSTSQYFLTQILPNVGGWSGDNIIKLWAVWIYSQGHKYLYTFVIFHLNTTTITFEMKQSRCDWSEAFSFNSKV